MAVHAEVWVRAMMVVPIDPSSWSATASTSEVDRITFPSTGKPPQREREREREQVNERETTRERWGGRPRVRKSGREKESSEQERQQERE